MSDQDIESNDAVNYLEMSDEAFLEVSPDSAVYNEPEVESETGGYSDTENDSFGSDVEDGNYSESYEESDEDSESFTEEEQTSESESASEESLQEDSADTLNEESSDSNQIDYQAAYERITSPFKASGREIQVKDTDDAIRLMQMGADYAKKMEGLKPHLKLVKTLNAKGLLEDDKLNLLIDAAQGNKEAIQQIVKNNNLDIDDLTSYEDEEGNSQYQPTDHIISDKDYEMQSVLDELRATPTYGKMLNVVTRDWSEGSRELIEQQPVILKTINQHIESGLFETISNKLEDMKLFGTYPSGVPEVEVYGRIFAEMEQNSTVETTKAVADAVQQRDAEKVKAKRKAVTKTKQAGGRGKAVIPNILEMSDEEFLRQTDMSVFRTV